MKSHDSHIIYLFHHIKISGVKPILEYPRLLIDISHVQELKGYILDQNLVVGSGNTLADVLAIFKKVAAVNDGFKYLEVLRKHIKLVAHTTIRNVRILFIAANIKLIVCPNV